MTSNLLPIRSPEKRKLLSLRLHQSKSQETSQASLGRNYFSCIPLSARKPLDSNMMKCIPTCGAAWDCDLARACLVLLLPSVLFDDAVSNGDPVLIQHSTAY
ncbi:hypothetical protein DL98DRAFT_511404 [Cadophora sp. DSE1049]|nr:hypothetical protein DL98DRAFT_511404 [Cadophora sp. DSE1049]